jgi:type II secretory pathway pseudopilin PulG
MIIVGILATVSIANFITSSEQTSAQMARNNLLAISAAQQRYSEDNDGSYCINSGVNPACGDNLVNLNTNLRLGMAANDPFAYSCAAGSPYLCTATNGSVKLTTSGSGVVCTAGGVNCPP